MIYAAWLSVYTAAANRSTKRWSPHRGRCRGVPDVARRSTPADAGPAAGRVAATDGRADLRGVAEALVVDPAGLHRAGPGHRRRGPAKIDRVARLADAARGLPWPEYAARRSGRSGCRRSSSPRRTMSRATTRPGHSMRRRARSTWNSGTRSGRTSRVRSSSVTATRCCCRWRWPRPAPRAGRPSGLSPSGPRTTAQRSREREKGKR